MIANGLDLDRYVSRTCSGVDVYYRLTDRERYTDRQTEKHKQTYRQIEKDTQTDRQIEKDTQPDRQIKRRHLCVHEKVTVQARHHCPLKV